MSFYYFLSRSIRDALRYNSPEKLKEGLEELRKFDPCRGDDIDRVIKEMYVELA